MFIPTTMAEVTALGWHRLDIILVTGDTYIDSPFMGISLIGKILIKDGFRVGIIAQPGLNTARDILRLGPRLYSGGHGRCRGFHGGQLHAFEKTAKNR